MNVKQQILIFDEDKSYLSILQEELSLVGYQVVPTSDTFELEKFLREDKFPVLILCVNEKQSEYLEFVKKTKQCYPFTEIIILARRGDLKSAFNSLMFGVHNYLTKLEDITNLIPVIDSAFDKALMKFKKSPTTSWICKGSTVGPLPELIGEHVKMKKLAEIIKKVAPASLLVLITGETGVGKELVSQYIHHYSARRDKPFIPFNCSAIPDTLLESELFGHEKGAFTDAISLKHGLFEECDNGTLFLDEVGEASPVFQSKLLRVIETGKFRRLGGNQEIKVDVRIISATNKDLYAEVKQNKFRADLYYRLAGAHIAISPLRDRIEDIPVLANHFLDIANRSNRVKKKFSKTAIHILLEHNWPGNVRELKNCIDRLACLSEGDIITPSDIALAIPDLMIDSVDIDKLLRKTKSAASVPLDANLTLENTEAQFPTI